MITKMIALDWRAMKYYQIRFPILPIFAFVFGCFYSPLLVIPICVIMCLSFSINPFAVEEKGELNNLYLTLPVKRSTIVAGRFVLSFIMLVCGLIMGIPIMSLANHFSLSKWYLSFNWYAVIFALSYLLYAIFNLFMFPILFKLGYHKGKFWGFYLPTIFFGLLVGVYFAIESSPGNVTLSLDFLVYASEHMLLLSGGMAVLATILLLISYVTSISLYSKRDF